MNWKRTAIVAATALGIGATAFAQQTQTQAPPPAMGPGMGSGMMGGHGPGYPGNGPGWHHRDGDDWGWGMGGRGGWGMDPGMMGRYGGMGMGPGMMGGMPMMGGMGMGMMGPGLGLIARLDLTDSQRQQVLKVEDDLRRKNWDVMGKMQDDMARLRDAWSAGKRDRAAILAAYKDMSDLRLKMIENTLDARDKAEALLTPQQREQLKRHAW